MMVRFKCGCIGVETSSGKPFVIKPCDPDAAYPGPYYLGFRNLTGPEPLPPEEEEKILLDLALLVSEGYKLRELRSILGTAGVFPGRS